MHSIIVVPAHSAGPRDQVRLEPGETLRFGRSSSPPGGKWLSIAHDGVSRSAGEITANGAYWVLSNLSARQTYVVENPEGAGEHIKVAPGRLDAPVPFEFSRVVLPAAGDLLSFEVWAPRHDYASGPREGAEAAGATEGAATAPAFALDRSKRYFAVLTALCEPRLRGEPHAPLPTMEQAVERLRPGWPSANRATVQWNIDYLAVKLRLKPAPDTGDCGPRLNGKKESLVSLALRFDLVQETDLRGLPSLGQAGKVQP
ncbi:FHA domain-containing protein [Streptomyces sp. ISL-98]|uniref:FHA domain-containing protein n=1 Tax=Streptomyces sp. ISL-98 TaxID=2819192 RepID=UPI001BE5CEC9|nr:FHA domain-containing protein [Streptomyces sp. ISL-98]MBT2507175.1 FHA domain-containing protein [Streptomyces sp. ISL-98]